MCTICAAVLLAGSSGLMSGPSYLVVLGNGFSLEGELAWNFGLFETCTDRCTQLLRIKRGHGPYLNQMAIGG